MTAPVVKVGGVPVWSSEAQARQAALEAVLLFHGGGLWDEKKASIWQYLTGTREATTVVLCDTVRAALNFEARRAIALVEESGK